MVPRSSDLIAAERRASQLSVVIRDGGGGGGAAAGIAAVVVGNQEIRADRGLPASWRILYWIMVSCAERRARVTDER